MPSAGEVEQYVYCPHNWLLARRGVEGNEEEAERGQREHQRFFRDQNAAERRRRQSSLGLSWAVRLMLFAASIILAVIIAIDSQPIENELGLALVGGTLLAGSSVLLTLGLFAEMDWLRRTRRDGTMPAQAIFTGDGEVPLLRDAVTNLSGRPDSILMTKSGYVPVELKTGRTPDKPYASHVMQTACYLRLLEAGMGAQPEYGLIVYPKGVFRVAWDDTLRSRLDATLTRLEESRATGKADRDHDDAGRCHGCARRAMCTQRLA